MTWAEILDALKLWGYTDDEAQDTVVRLLASGHETPGPGLVRRTAQRARSDRKRARSREVLAGVPEEVPGPEVSVVDRLWLGWALCQLPVTQRQVLQVVYGAGKTLEEAAVILGIPSGTVSSRLHRARQQLRALDH